MESKPFLKKLVFEHLFQALRWLIRFLIDLLGARLIWYKINPPSKKRVDAPKYKPPRTIILWVIGIYVTCFGIASQRYENKKNVIEGKVNSIAAQLSIPEFKNAVSRIAKIQKMPCPRKVEILKPDSVFLSLFWPEVPCDEIIDLLKELVESKKDSLDNVDFAEVDLSGADLSFGSFQGANFHGTDLRGTRFVGANLKGATIWMCNLQEAYFVSSNLQGSNIVASNLENTYFWGADLQNVKGLYHFNLCKASTLAYAKLDPLIEKKIKENCPSLLEGPTVLSIPN